MSDHQSDLLKIDGVKDNVYAKIVMWLLMIATLFAALAIALYPARAVKASYRTHKIMALPMALIFTYIVLFVIVAFGTLFGLFTVDQVNHILLQDLGKGTATSPALIGFCWALAYFIIGRAVTTVTADFCFIRNCIAWSVQPDQFVATMREKALSDAGFRNRVIYQRQNGASVGTGAALFFSGMDPDQAMFAI